MRLRRGMTSLLAGLMLAATIMPAVARAQTPVASEADLAGLKDYLVEHVTAMHEGTSALVDQATRYYQQAEAADFDYAALWQAQSAELAPWLAETRRVWTDEAHGNYELIEGMVAGIPSLAHFDEVIDAGASKTDDPVGAVDLQVTLPDGQVLDRPGNLFHYLTEPALWGTEEAFVGAPVDLDGDGQVEVTEALPDASVLLGSAQALDAQTDQLAQAIAAWTPNEGDAFTALVVMIPTMSGYFEEWKESPYVLGEASTSRGFVANSRLLDVLGILGGLEVTYDRVSPRIAATDPDLATQIGVELEGLIAFVQDLSDQENAGTRFTPEQADQFGAELQSRATSLAGQIVQAAALLEIPIQDA